MESQDYKKMIDDELTYAIHYAERGDVRAVQTHLNQAGFVLNGWLKMVNLEDIRESVDAGEAFMERIREQGREEVRNIEKNSD